MFGFGNMKTAACRDQCPVMNGGIVVVHRVGSRFRGQATQTAGLELLKKGGRGISDAGPGKSTGANTEG